MPKAFTAEFAEGSRSTLRKAKTSGLLDRLSANWVGGGNVKIGVSQIVWRGEEYGLEQAGSGLEKIVAQSLRQAPPAEAPLMAWPVVCGSAVAERTRALSFADGVLRVEVSGPRWRAELQTLAPRYLAMINRYTSEMVRRIEFVLARAEGAGKERG